MKERTELKHPAYLDIVTTDGQRVRGADQDWFRQKWQRMAGCGPTAAAVQLAYLARAWQLPALCPMEALEQEPFVDFMEQVWRHVTPGFRGLNKVPMYTGGVEAFARERGVALKAEALEVPPDAPRVSIEACAAFLRAGLERDCPVAFLNLHNGEEEKLDAWHWVLVTGLEEADGQVQCTIADGGVEFAINLSLWHRTTKDRGGFVRIRRERAEE